MGHWLCWPTRRGGRAISSRCATTASGASGYTARDQHRAGIAAYGQDSRARSAGYLDALADWVLGYPWQACAGHGTRRRRTPHQLGHPFSVGLTLFVLRPTIAAAPGAWARTGTRGRGDSGICRARLMRWSSGAYCRADGPPHRGGKWPPASPTSREAMERRRTMGMGAVWPWYLALSAEAQARYRPDRGRFVRWTRRWQWVGKTTNTCTKPRSTGSEVSYYSPGRPDPVRAEKCFQEALSLARREQAKSWELRAASSMGRIWLQNGRLDDARAPPHAHLQLVHRRVRHRRYDGSKGAPGEVFA